MANLPEAGGWINGIYQLETTDPVEAGVEGISNLQAKQLASRTKYLYDIIEAMQWRTGDVKEVDCNAAYVAANFDSTGLGINEREGWAICNGNNGTRNRAGRVGVAYGTGYTGLGNTAGSKDDVVVSHNHVANANVLVTAAAGEGVGLQLGTGFRLKNIGSGTITDATGVTGTDKNMQPYIISLFIQKL